VRRGGIEEPLLVEVATQDANDAADKAG
jgi:hypothetical protein